MLSLKVSYLLISVSICFLFIRIRLNLRSYIFTLQWSTWIEWWLDNVSWHSLEWKFMEQARSVVVVQRDIPAAATSRYLKDRRGTWFPHVHSFRSQQLSLYKGIILPFACSINLCPRLYHAPFSSCDSGKICWYGSCGDFVSSTDMVWRAVTNGLHERRELF